jgi:hypothetical protein
LLKTINKIVDQFELQRSDAVIKDILIKKLINIVNKQENSIFELDNSSRLDMDPALIQDLKLSDISNKNPKKLYVQIEK